MEISFNFSDNYLYQKGREDDHVEFNDDDEIADSRELIITNDDERYKEEDPMAPDCTGSIFAFTDVQATEFDAGTALFSDCQ